MTTVGSVTPEWDPPYQVRRQPDNLSVCPPGCVSLSVYLWHSLRVVAVAFCHSRLLSLSLSVSLSSEGAVTPVR